MEGRGDRSSGRSRSVPQVLVSQSLRVSSGRLGAAVGPPGLRQVHPAGHRPGEDLPGSGSGSGSRPDPDSDPDPLSLTSAGL